MRLAHIINPYAAPAGSLAALAQPLSFAAILAAQKFHGETVSTIAVRYPDERLELPPGFIDCPKLSRSAADLRRFKVPRRLPLIGDIVSAGPAEAEGADYLVFTNMDICPMPHFYGAVVQLVRQGFDAIVINRRTIPKLGWDARLLPLMYAEQGKPHAGFDCFVFPRAMVKSFVPMLACLGVSGAGRAMLYNLVGLAKALLIVKDAHLTFHLGDDQLWNDDSHREYLKFNLHAWRNTIIALSKLPPRRARLTRFCEAYGEKVWFRGRPPAADGTA